MPYPKIKLPNSPKVKAHCLRVGQIIYLWNQIHAVFFLCFLSIIGNDKEKSIKNMWDEAGTDTSQRKIIKSYLAGMESNEVIDEIIWIMHVIDELSQYRNAFVHTPMLDSTSGILIPINFAAKVKYMDNIKKIHDGKLFVKFKKDIIEFTQYAFDVTKCFSSGKELPPRPLLRAFPDLPVGMRKRIRPKIHRASPHQLSLARALMGNPQKP